MGEMGCRISELTFGPDDIRESTHDDVDILFVTIYGKKSKGRGTKGNRRDAWVPRDLYEDLEEYRKIEGFGERAGYFPEDKLSMAHSIKRSAENAVSRTGNDDFQHVTAHDFRVFFATNMMLRERVDPEVVMELGGWEDRDRIDPYLNALFDDVIQDALADAGLFSDEVDVEPDPLEMLQKEIAQLRDAVNSLDQRLSLDDPRDDSQAGFDDL
ncbi:site-specific integrase [Halorubrum vacuolatum]|nr:site-specific integrase [Halorubrum vacuolatum]